MTNAGDAPVVFRPLYERDATFWRIQRLMSRKRMTDHGDHVLWDDGKTQWRWRLPDQAASGAPYPIMTTVFIGAAPSPRAPGGIGAYMVCFFDAAGVILGRLTGFRTLMVSHSYFDGMLMPEAWEPLERRGVTILRESLAPGGPNRHFARQHPEPMVNRHFFIRFPKRGAARREAARRTGLVLPDEVGNQ